MWGAKNIILILLFLFCGGIIQAKEDIEFHINKPIARGVPGKIVIQAMQENSDGRLILANNYNQKVTIQGIFIEKTKKTEQPEFQFKDGVLEIEAAEIRSVPVEIRPLKPVEKSNLHVFTFPAIFTLIPPILAIILAVVTKEVIISLFIGVWSAVFVREWFTSLSEACWELSTHMSSTPYPTKSMSVSLFLA